MSNIEKRYILTPKQRKIYKLEEMEMKEVIQYYFFVEGYSYEIKYRDRYILNMYLGQLKDDFTPMLQTIYGVTDILEYLQLRCIPMDVYLEMEKVFMEQIL